jgi:hypothetical protein
MTVHQVEQGDCMSSIAARYGLTDWHDVYDHPDNAELKDKRPNPNILAPGDEVVVPDLPRRWIRCGTEKNHRFVVPVPRAKLRIVIRSQTGEALADRRFVVRVGGRTIEGKTSSVGLIDEPIPALATSARLQVWCRDDDPDDPDPTLDRELLLGHLDPIDTVPGVQGRLFHLGYYCEVTGEIDAATIAAARSFRAAAGLPAVEVPDDSEDDDDAAAQQRAYLDELVDDAFRKALVAQCESSAGATDKGAS